MPRTSVWGTNPPKCGAQLRAAEGYCSRTAGWGTNHLGVGCCKTHGGNSASHVNKAAKTLVMQQMAAHWGDLVVVDPGEALIQEVHRAQGVVTWIHMVLRSFTTLNFDHVTEAEARSMVLQMTAFNGLQATVWVEMFFKERRHLAQVAKMALDAGVAERAVTIEEEKMALVAGAIKDIFNELGLTVEQRAKFPEIARRHLTAIEGKAS